ncbi:hypothetical protein MGG_01432 [Pyricularia oryzae 70-15]|uniref:COP9 signalosome complex subunit 6 n=1 Tax=Pyricularia oryzae (strain 70-15 / ATCC MYA-4617 / FGSC 8958) TaxID=242507 RepID=G4MZL5_PYRO7|nr:uncharacterized protein MGG_01432 [Pyricularia oryzae 70-15]EHA54574.1 hypothetical protein MGG_01432 [Pyricularia oryzae 70-15]
MASEMETNPLISTQKSDSELHVGLHPLVLLTVSDYITRHTLRGQTCSIVGAILGQQNGTKITMEHAFECLTQSLPNGDLSLDQDWFTNRLDQMKLVHKDRNLDLVGWFTLLPRAGPDQRLLQLHNQILAVNESAALLALHPEDIAAAAGSKLPVTIYETVLESDDQRQNQSTGGDEEMKDSGNESAETSLKPRFRELPYSVETAEDEMISMAFVARGGANAGTTTVVDDPANRKKSSVSSVQVDTKGKRRAVTKEEEEEETGAAEPVPLSREDEELVSTLTAKANAIKMLSARIQLITKYLEGLPPSYLSGDQSRSALDVSHQTSGTTSPSPVLLRSIQALVNRIPLLIPSSTEAFKQDMLSEANDVQIVSLLNDVLQSVNELRDVGKKFHVVELAKPRKGDNSSLLGIQQQMSTAGDIMS